MTSWRDLETELDAWAEAGLAAQFWWRDDDAVEPTPALDRLLGLAARHDAPLALAVVPARATQSLGRLLNDHPLATPVQHGFAHRNHAPPREKKAELGLHRCRGLVTEELLRGRALMMSLFGRRFLPMLVPPWNRIAGGLVETLPSLGMTAVSAYGSRASAEPVAGLGQVNTHADIMRWTEPRGFLGEAEALSALYSHLQARRQGRGQTGSLDPTEPTGILTHHLAHDEEAWDFLAHLLRLLAEHDAASILSVARTLEIGGATP